MRSEDFPTIFSLHDYLLTINIGGLIYIASLERQILIEAQDKVGLSQELSSLLSQKAKDNLRLWYGSSYNGKAQFFVIPDQYAKVWEVLKSSPTFKNCHEDHALVIRTKNQVGSIAEITKRLSSKGFNINSLFTTTFFFLWKKILLQPQKHRTLVRPLHSPGSGKQHWILPVISLYRTHWRRL